MTLLIICLFLGILFFLLGLILRGVLKLFSFKNIRIKNTLFIVLLDIIFLILLSLLSSLVAMFNNNIIILLIIGFLLNIFVIGFLLNRIYKITFWKGVISGFLQHIVGIIIGIFLILPIILYTRFFIATPFTIIGSAMSPNLIEGDFVVVDKTNNKMNFKRGDIIVFTLSGKNTTYIKRIIGLPGETVKIENGDVNICKNNLCKKLSEDYLLKDTKTETRCNKNEFQVSDGYFVIGDKRGFSTDSLCCFGLECNEGSNYIVPYQSIIGKVFVRLFPNPKSF